MTRTLSEKMSRRESNTEVADELGVALDLDMDLFCILLQSEGNNFSKTPEMLLVIVVLADDTHLV